MPFLPILTLTLAAFAIGTTEFAVQGLLPQIAADLEVGIPVTGLLVTGYALGVALGGPIATVATIGLRRKRALLVLLGFFVAGHIIAALAPNYAVLLTARVVSSLCHASFMGIGSVVAVGIVGPDRRAAAVALMWGGIASANILGVPAGTWLGQAFGWRAAFWAIGALGLGAAGAIALFLPDTGRGTMTRLGAEVRSLGRPQVLLTLAFCATTCAATFSVFTYIAPLLLAVTGIAPIELPFYLLLFGLGGVTGMQVGGRFGNRRVLVPIIGAFIAQFLIYLLLPALFRDKGPSMAAMFIWGFAFYFPAPHLQLRIVDVAPDAPNLASTAIQSAFNLGIAAGPFVGAVMLSVNAGYARLPFCGAALSMIGVGLGLYAFLDDRSARRASVT